MEKINHEYKWAEYYDRIYSHKDYKSESVHIDKLIRQYKRSEGNKLLDAACGTGNHIEYLKDKYDITGLDKDANMLKLARKKYKDIKFIRADMSKFELGEKFDVIVCLFSAIGHLENYNELNKALRCFSRHLKPGGVVIIEPFLQFKDIKRNLIHHVLYEKDNELVFRLNYSEVKGIKMYMDFHFLIAENSKIRYLKEKMGLSMFDMKKFLDIMKRNKLTSKYERNGLMKSRGLYIGIKKDD